MQRLAPIFNANWDDRGTKTGLIGRIVSQCKLGTLYKLGTMRHPNLMTQIGGFQRKLGSSRAQCTDESSYKLLVSIQEPPILQEDHIQSGSVGESGNNGKCHRGPCSRLSSFGRISMLP